MPIGQMALWPGWAAGGDVGVAALYERRPQGPAVIDRRYRAGSTSWRCPVWVRRTLMLSRLLRRLATSCPPAARQLGLLREHEDIAKRHARVRAAWASHLTASRQVILETAGRCSRHRRALVI